MNDIPNHIAFIMDGNGRWAKMRALPRNAGHKEGLKSAERLIDCCIDRGVCVVSLFVFSTENWKRPKLEVDSLFSLADEYLDRLTEFARRGVRIVVSGEMDNLPARLVRKIEKACAATAANKILTLNLCINYGGRSEIVAAVNNLLESNIRRVTEDLFERFLYVELPAPDLIVRTGGQMRLSNFLLFQAAYAELYFCDTLWPDFGEKDLDTVLEVYKNRVRNFGGI